MDNENLLTGYRSKNKTHLEYQDGDFVVGDLDSINGFAISSVVSAFPWYWTITPEGKLLQGPNVFDLCATAKIGWEWNFPALNQIALIGHTIGTHTLHKNIFRMPPNSRLTLNNGKVQIQQIDSLSNWLWNSRDLDTEFKALSEAFQICIDNDHEPMLSLSAGYDSRVLLALCVKFGCSPIISTMGTNAATDVKVARMLTKQLGHVMEQVEIEGDDYIRFGLQISKASSGVKTAGDWHTWLYSYHLGERKRVHLVGSNGEFARTFYSDFITRSLPYRFGGRMAEWSWQALKITNRRRKISSHVLSSIKINLGQVFVELFPSKNKYPKPSLECLDTFYAIERVHHIIGSGLACYNEFSNPRSPFLHKGWMQDAAALTRYWKTENRYHRACIEKFAPQLADIPNNQDPDNGQKISYSPFETLCSNQKTQSLIIESAELDFFIDRKSRIAALNDVRAYKLDTMSFLLTLHFAAANARLIDRAL